MPMPKIITGICLFYLLLLCVWYFVFSAGLSTISIIQRLNQLLVCMKALLFLCILFVFIHNDCLFICLVDGHSFTYWLFVICLLSAVTSCRSLPSSLLYSSVDFFALILHMWHICHSLCDHFQDAAITQKSMLGQNQMSSCYHCCAECVLSSVSK